MVGRRLLSTICDDTVVAFEDVLSKRLVLHCLLSTGCGDLFVAFLQAWGKVMLCNGRATSFEHDL